MIIVTGGAGFIGSNIVKKLNDNGIKKILIVDEFPNYKKLKNLEALDFLDYIDKEKFISNLNKYSGGEIDTIFHQGACSDTMEKDKEYMLKTNYEYSKTLLNFCLEKKIKFIYASSASVYGSGEKGFRENEGCEMPLNCYAVSKSLFDSYASRKRNTEIQITGLRYFNVYGPQENHKDRMASVIFNFHNQILSNKKIKLFEGSNNFLRDFVSVEDIANINMYFFENNKSGIFNCGTGIARSFVDLAGIMKDLYPPKIDIEFIPFPDELSGKYQSFTLADLTNLRNAGYKKEFLSLEEGIRRYVTLLQKTGGYLKKD